MIGLGEWLTGINLNGFVDPSSSAYAAGGRTAGVVLLVLMVAAPGAMPALLAMQALGQGWSAAEAFQRGDYATGFTDLGNAPGGGGCGGGGAGGAGGRPGGGGVGGSGGGGDGGGGAAGGGRGGADSGAGAEGEAGALNPEQAAPNPVEPPTGGSGVGENEFPTDEACDPATDGGCFPIGTLVGALDGPRRIEAVRMDERVWAYDLVTGQWRPCRVIQTLTREYRKHSVLITAAGETVESTEAHPFWVLRGEGLEARPSRPGLPSAPPRAATPGRWVEGATYGRATSCCFGAAGSRWWRRWGWPLPRGGVQLPRGRAGVLLRRRSRLPRP